MPELALAARIGVGADHETSAAPFFFAVMATFPPPLRSDRGGGEEVNPGSAAKIIER
jgi:hypothetical protein